jgi:hypothetical protein
MDVRNTCIVETVVGCRWLSLGGVCDGISLITPRLMIPSEMGIREELLELVKNLHCHTIPPMLVLAHHSRIELYRPGPQLEVVQV